MNQRFHDTFGSVEGANLSQDMSRIRPLTPTGFEPSMFFAKSQHSFQEAFFCAMSHQTSTKLTQDAVIKSRISQL
jgi:hypothetical protein